MCKECITKIADKCPVDSGAPYDIVLCSRCKRVWISLKLNSSGEPIN